MPNDEAHEIDKGSEEQRFQQYLKEHPELLSPDSKEGQIIKNQERIEEKVDTGEWILQKDVPVGDAETAGELHDRLSLIGSDVLLETVDLIENGSAPRRKQQGKITKAPKISKDICRINWTKDVVSIYNLIRGLSPYPRAFCYLQEREIKILNSNIESLKTKENTEPGQIVTIDEERLLVATGKGILAVTEVQPESRRRMTIGEYLRGRSISIGEQFT